MMIATAEKLLAMRKQRKVWTWSAKLNKLDCFKTLLKYFLEMGIGLSKILFSKWHGLTFKMFQGWIRKIFSLRHGKTFFDFPQIAYLLINYVKQLELFWVGDSALEQICSTIEQ